MAAFWSEALGRPVNAGANSEFAAINATDPATTGPRLAFHQVPEPKTVKNRLHLDLINSEYEAEAKRLLGLGATHIRDMKQGDARWTTLADPEGNEFDLIAG
ncbi:VOC family protein [Actinacidiphila oryziradicis]|uniref:VOC family protein n=1 Tax=Actinacidiphila oryziradicis TaxID=2571141 RepID=A0A4U0S134_9ACTN|nr:VOC family protein [Actinacidiphila oryziradicis]